MPELPEVETFARSLDRRITGKRVASCRLLFRPLLKSGRPGRLRSVEGRRVAGLGRRGKYLFLHFEGGLSFVFHLKMTGQFRFAPEGAAADKHVRLVLGFGAGSPDLHFRDVRKFGCLYVAPSESLGRLPALAGLGPEPLAVSSRELRELIGARKGRLKSLLLNQEFLAGIGNIYADEILFRSGLHPLRPASSLGPDDVRRLRLSIRTVLRRAIRSGGSSIRDYSDSDGARGRYQLSHLVYGRESEPCRRCGTPIERRVIGGRSSFFCPKCQPPESRP